MATSSYRAEIYYQTLNIQTITQKEKYDVRIFLWFLYQALLNFILQAQGIVAALGGALSLYLGIAIAMVFEFIELIFDIMSVVLRDKK